MLTWIQIHLEMTRTMQKYLMHMLKGLSSARVALKKSTWRWRRQTGWRQGQCWLVKGYIRQCAISRSGFTSGSFEFKQFGQNHIPQLVHVAFTPDISLVAVDMVVWCFCYGFVLVVVSWCLVLVFGGWCFVFYVWRLAFGGWCFVFGGWWDQRWAAFQGAPLIRPQPSDAVRKIWGTNQQLARQSIQLHQWYNMVWRIKSCLAWWCVWWGRAGVASKHGKRYPQVIMAAGSKIQR